MARPVAASRWAPRRWAAAADRWTVGMRAHCPTRVAAAGTELARLAFLGACVDASRVFRFVGGRPNSHCRTTGCWSNPTRPRCRSDPVRGADRLFGARERDLRVRASCWRKASLRAETPWVLAAKSSSRSARPASWRARKRRLGSDISSRHYPRWCGQSHFIVMLVQPPSQGRSGE